jgi:type I restriction enzyme S subunit
LLSSRAPIGYVAIAKNPIATNQGFRNLISKPGNVPEFIYYWLTANVPELERHASGSTFKEISGTTLKGIPIRVPSEAEQRAIAYILGTLDDKIELNRRMNETLEAMARSIFKSWFVDFDPVRAKAEGRDPGLPKHIAHLFPDSFEDSELGEIPKGWKVRPFSMAVEIIGGGTPKTNVDEYWNGDIPWFSIADAPNENDVFVIDTKMKINQTGINHSATRILPIGTTIISARGTVGKVALVGVPMAMNQSCYGLQGTGAGPYFTYFATRQLVVALKQRSHGSVFDTITRDTLDGVEMITPSGPELDTFEGFVASLMERIRHNLKESKTLADLRGTLLPKLISGGVCVGDHLRAEFT